MHPKQDIINVIIRMAEQLFDRERDEQDAYVLVVWQSQNDAKPIVDNFQVSQMISSTTRKLELREMLRGISKDPRVSAIALISVACLAPLNDPEARKLARQTIQRAVRNNAADVESAIRDLPGVYPIYHVGVSWREYEDVFLFSRLIRNDDGCWMLGEWDTMAASLTGSSLANFFAKSREQLMKEEEKR